jgi:hypothetical protein
MAAATTATTVSDTAGTTTTEGTRLSVMHRTTFHYGAPVRMLPATRMRHHHFELHEPHVRLEIESRIRVHNLPLLISDAGRSAGLEGDADPTVQERIWPYMQEIPRVFRSLDVWRKAVDVTAGMNAVFQQASAIMAWIHESDARYVKIAVRRDNGDVSPVAGSYRGTARCRLEVKVEVEKL